MLEYTKHEKISLKGHPEFNERWLQNLIAEDPSILGLGELRLLDRERASQGGGRLDLLLSDDDAERRYEVEIQLNYLKGYIGLQSGGVSNNFVHIGPRATRRFAHLNFRNTQAAQWVAKFEEAGVPARSARGGRFRISVTPRNSHIIGISSRKSSRRP